MFDAYLSSLIRFKKYRTVLGFEQASLKWTSRVDDIAGAVKEDFREKMLDEASTLKEGESCVIDGK